MSTLDDLLKWDRAVATGTLVGAQTLSEALVPATVVEGTSTYAFGWNVGQRHGDTFIWHTGNSGDRRAFLGRRVNDRITVIILTSGDSRRLEIADAVVDILHDRPYTAPPLSIARRLIPVIKEQGVDAAIAAYERLRATEPTAYDFGEGELNRLGYTLLGRGDVGGAVRIFEHNARRYPESSNVFESLRPRRWPRPAAATTPSRRTRRAGRSSNPSNINAQTMLKKLK